MANHQKDAKKPVTKPVKSGGTAKVPRYEQREEAAAPTLPGLSPKAKK